MIRSTFESSVYSHHSCIIRRLRCCDLPMRATSIGWDFSRLSLADLRLNMSSASTSSAQSIYSVRKRATRELRGWREGDIVRDPERGENNDSSLSRQILANTLVQWISREGCGLYWHVKSTWVPIFIFSEFFKFKHTTIRNRKLRRESFGLSLICVYPPLGQARAQRMLPSFLSDGAFGYHYN